MKFQPGRKRDSTRGRVQSVTRLLKRSIIESDQTDRPLPGISTLDSYGQPLTKKFFDWLIVSANELSRMSKFTEIKKIRSVNKYAQ